MEEIRSRRSLLKTAGFLVPLALVSLPALARTRGPRQLSFYHTHTSEKLDVVYAEDGVYIPNALNEINYLLRDFRSGHIHAIEPRLLDILHGVQERTGSAGQFEVISGFRSVATNEMLRHQSTGVAQNSLHLKGQAIDVRLTGAATRNLRRAAVAMRQGGVGYYPTADFVHLDTGRFRTW